MKDYSSSAPEGPRPKRWAEKAEELPPMRCPRPGAIRAAAGLSRTAGGPGRGRGTRAAAAGTGTSKDGGARHGRLALLGLASRRPCSCTRARVLLTNGPDARGWSGDGRRWYSRASRPARPWSQPPPPPPPFLALQTPPRHSQVFLLSNLPFCAPPQPAKRGFAPMAGGTLEGNRGGEPSPH